MAKHDWVGEREAKSDGFQRFTDEISQTFFFHKGSGCDLPKIISLGYIVMRYSEIVCVLSYCSLFIHLFLRLTFWQHSRFFASNKFHILSQNHEYSTGLKYESTDLHWAAWTELYLLNSSKSFFRLKPYFVAIVGVLLITSAKLGGPLNLAHSRYFLITWYKHCCNDIFF